MKTAYIVKAYRTAVGKAPRGVFRFKRADELGAETIQHMMKELPDLDVKRIDDVIVGNAMPEAEQGLNMGRLISLMGIKIEDVPGMTVNRYCASGLETVSIAVAKIQSGMADCIIAGGVESMSYIPMGGYRPVPNYKSAKEGHEDYYWGMGLTAEAVAKQFKVSREDQDEFSFKSHMKALDAQANGKFNDGIAPISVENIFLDDNGKTIDILYPTETSKSFIKIVEEAKQEINPTITCKAQESNSIYVGANGNIAPCCWLDLEWLPPVSESRIDYMDKIGNFPNLNKHTLQEIFDSNFFSSVESTWSNGCLKECQKQCGKFDKLGAQFES